MTIAEIATAKIDLTAEAVRDGFRELVEALLGDEHGISTDAYVALLDLYVSIEGQEAAADLNARTDATDGRFYFDMSRSEG